jgi:hypothetical protein
VETHGAAGDPSHNGGKLVQTPDPTAVLPQVESLAVNSAVATRSRREATSPNWRTLIITATSMASDAFALWWFTPLPRLRVERIDQITYSARIDTPIKPGSDGEHVYYIQRAGDHWHLMETMAGEGDGRRINAPGRNAMVLDERLVAAAFAAVFRWARQANHIS